MVGRWGQTPGTNGGTNGGTVRDGGVRPQGGGSGRISAMARPVGRFVRDNIFLIAAVLLPLAVVAFFLAASLVPARTVPPPAYDLVIKASGPYNRPPHLMVDYLVQGGRVVAHVRRVPPNGFSQHATLFLFQHDTGLLTEIKTDLPSELASEEESRDIPVEALAGRRIVTSEVSPDGYRLEMRPRRAPGIIGELFGMRRHDDGVSLVNGRHVIRLTPPAPHRYIAPISALGWIVPEGGDR